MEHELAGRGRGVDGLRERAQPDAAGPELGHDLDQVGQGAAEPVEAPDHQPVAARQVLEADLQARPVVSATGGLVLVGVALVDAGGAQGLPLQAGALPLVRR